jgi:LmbE family N-acetylglucosaminyl deacetylase
MDEVDEPRPERGAADPVRDSAGDLLGDERVDLLAFHQCALQAHAHHEAVFDPPSSCRDRVRDDCRHPGVALYQLRCDRVLGARRDLWDEIGECDLEHRLLTERRQDLCDIPEEGAARTQHHHLGARELRVVVQEVRGAVQPDRGLARPGPSLHREDALERRADHVILLGLDRRDDVEHQPAATALELGQQRVATPEPYRPELRDVVAEHIVGDRQELPILDHQLSTTHESSGIAGAGLVERLGHGSAPLDDKWIAAPVRDVPTADVPTIALLRVDSPENERPRRVAQERDATSHRDFVVELLEAPGRHDPVEDVLRARLHRTERGVRLADDRLLRRELVGHGRRPRSRLGRHTTVRQAVLMRELTLMAVHAHPDDESNSTGGTLARYSAEGVRTVLVTCTNGEFGDAPGRIKPDQDGHDPDDVARIRLEELAIATKALGVSYVETLGYRDSGMRGWPQNEDPRAFHHQPDDVVAKRLIGLLERFEPQVVVTYFAHSGYNHPDHLKAHDVTRLAVDRTGLPSKLYLIARPRSYRERLRAIADEYGIEVPPLPQPSKPPETGAANAPEPLRPFGVDDSLITTYIDATEYQAKKRAALAAHASQLEGSFFMRFPDDAFAKAFGVESFIRDVDRTGAPLPEDDLFAGLR